MNAAKEWKGYVVWWRALERPPYLFINLLVHLVESVFEWGTWLCMTIQGSSVISVEVLWLYICRNITGCIMPDLFITLLVSYSCILIKLEVPKPRYYKSHFFSCNLHNSSKAWKWADELIFACINLETRAKHEVRVRLTTMVYRNARDWWEKQYVVILTQTLWCP